MKGNDISKDLILFSFLIYMKFLINIPVRTQGNIIYTITENMGYVNVELFLKNDILRSNKEWKC